MSASIITGVFSLILLGGGWLLTNGSKTNRLIERIAKQTAILKDFPTDGEGREALLMSLRLDVLHLDDQRFPPTKQKKAGQDWPSISLGLAGAAGALLSVAGAFLPSNGKPSSAANSSLGLTFSVTAVLVVGLIAAAVTLVSGSRAAREAERQMRKSKEQLAEARAGTGDPEKG